MAGLLANSIPRIAYLQPEDAVLKIRAGHGRRAIQILIYSDPNLSTSFDCYLRLHKAV